MSRAPKRIKTEHDEESDILKENKSASISTTNGAMMIHTKVCQMAHLVHVDLQKDDVDSVVQAFEQITSYLALDTGNKQKNQSQFVNTGAPVLVAMVMRKWSHEESVQWKACLCIGTLASKSKVAVTAIRLSGCIETLLAAIQNFPEALTVQLAGIGSLVNIFKDDVDDFSSGLARGFIDDLNGLDSIHKAMTKFSDNEEVIVNTCLLLHLFSKYRHLQKFLIERGSVKAVGAAIEKYSNEKTIEALTKQFMQNVFR